MIMARTSLMKALGVLLTIHGAWSFLPDATMSASKLNYHVRKDFMLRSMGVELPSEGWWDQEPPRQLVPGSDDGYGSNNSFLLQGRRLVAMAVAADSQKMYQRAFTLYSEALAQLTKGIQYETNERKLEQTLADIESYMNRAEALFDLLANPTDTFDYDNGYGRSKVQQQVTTGSSYNVNNYGPPSDNRNRQEYATNYAQETPPVNNDDFHDYDEYNQYGKKTPPPKVKNNPYAASGGTGGVQQRSNAPDQRSGMNSNNYDNANTYDAGGDNRGQQQNSQNGQHMYNGYGDYNLLGGQPNSSGYNGMNNQYMQGPNSNPNSESTRNLYADSAGGSSRQSPAPTDPNSSYGRTYKTRLPLVKVKSNPYTAGRTSSSSSSEQQRRIDSNTIRPNNPNGPAQQGGTMENNPSNPNRPSPYGTQQGGAIENNPSSNSNRPSPYGGYYSGPPPLQQHPLLDISQRNPYGANHVLRRPPPMEEYGRFGPPPPYSRFQQQPRADYDRIRDDAILRGNYGEPIRMDDSLFQSNRDVIPGVEPVIEELEPPRAPAKKQRAIPSKVQTSQILANLNAEKSKIRASAAEEKTTTQLKPVAEKGKMSPRGADSVAPENKTTSAKGLRPQAAAAADKKPNSSSKGFTKKANVADKENKQSSSTDFPTMTAEERIIQKWVEGRPPKTDSP
jgi:hypothetical protein